MKKAWIAVAAILFLCHAKGSVAAAEDLRAASGGFTTAIHAVLWAAYEEKIFRKYGLAVEYLALNSGRLGMQMLLSDDVQILFSTGVTVVPTNLQKADLGPQNCFIVKRSYLDSNRDKVTNFMRAVVESIYLVKKDRPLAIRLIKKYIRVNDEEAAIGYDYYLAKHSEGISDLPDRRGLVFVIEETAKTNPKAAGQTPETLRLLEPSVLDEIKKSGFAEKVKQ